MKEAAPGTEGKKGWLRSAGSNIWYFFNSLKLTLFVLITLAIVSILGTVVEQNKPVEEYLAAYGQRWTDVIVYLRIYDLFHSWWYLGLLTLLALNIIVCTFERFPPKWKSLLHHRSEKFDPKLIDRFSNRQSVTLNASSAAVKERLLNAFRKKRFKVVVTGSGGEYQFYAWKGIAGRFGSDLTHVSLLLILLGAIVGNITGYKDYKAIFVGSSVTVPNEDFQVRLDKFWIDYYDTGQIRQYNSLLTVLENDREVLKKQIWVNEPLYYKGVRFYQSSYGMAWNRLEEATVALKKKTAGDSEPPVTVKWDTLAKIPESGYSVKLVGYSADFAYDEKTNTVFSISAEPNNPAVNLEVYDGDKLVSKPWIFLKYPGVFPAIPNSDDDLVLTGYRGIMYSGLSVNKDPGTNIVWAGTIVMGIGFYLAFFLYHRRVWVNVKETGKSTEVKVAGMINKNNFVFERDIKDILESISAG